MMYVAAIIAVAVAAAIVALVIFALRATGWAHDLGKSEADRDRLELQLRDLADDDIIDAAAHKARIHQLLAEQESLRAEIRRRRRPGDARSRLRLLSETPGEAADPNSPDGT